MRKLRLLAYALSISLLNPINSIASNVKLKPFTWQGNYETRMSAWSTATTLTADIITAKGPVKAKGIGAYDHFGNLYNVSFINADLETVIKQFRKTNPKLKSGSLENILSPIEVTNQESLDYFNKAIKDGEISESESDSLNNGAYGYFYVAENDSGKIVASLPGILVFEKGKEVAIPKPLPYAEPVKEEQPEEITPPIRYNVYNIINGKSNFGIGFGIDHVFDDKDYQIYSLYFNNLPLSDINLSLGYGERTKEPEVSNYTSQTTNGLYAEGRLIDKEKSSMVDATVGFKTDASEKLAFVLGTGIAYDLVNKTQEVKEAIYRNGLDVPLKTNTDSYIETERRVNPKAYVGIENKYGKNFWGLRAGLRGSKPFLGFKGGFIF